jgi:hypothetical protein
MSIASRRIGGDGGVGKTSRSRITVTKYMARTRL